MPLKLSSPVTDIPRVGPAKAKYLQKLGITHARDFLFTFPRRHDDFSQVTKIKDLKDDTKMTIRGRVKQVNSSWGFQGRRRIFRIFVDIEDDTGTLAVTWYNLRFLPKQLWQGREISIAGQAEQKDGNFRMRSPAIEFDQSDTHTGRITPIYPETYGVTSRFLRYHVKNLLPLFQAIPEYLPKDLRSRNKLIGIHQAVTEVHFPTNSKQLKQARRRLRFDELFFLQLAALVRRQKRQHEPATAVKINNSTIQQFSDALPFKLTSDQQAAIKEIADDMSKAIPMNRILQGDVGSGKSAVALISTQATLESGHKVLYLAPTEVLARQQFDSFRHSIKNKPVELLIGSTKQRDKKSIKAALAGKGPLCVIGTHALLQEDVQVKDLALAIVDEQHRFGVKQRQALQKRNAGTMPHLLSMTATPIPRTLSLTVYGDLDVSIICEKPPGRQPIKTKIVAPDQRDQAITQILAQLHQGRQAYVIAPLVEKSDKLQVKSAEETEVEMKQYFPDIAIGLVHGRLKAEEKHAVMNNFAAGAIQLLVATAVVEVGVNVPNATCMIIEGAERFGLAQLHQFRGRIGRGQHASTCYLFPTASSGTTNERLQILAKTNDGFKIAEADLRLRGPGDTYGTQQSGFDNLQVASLLDYPMIKLTRTEAGNLLTHDPHLKKHIILRKKVAQKNLQTHFE